MQSWESHGKFLFEVSIDRRTCRAGYLSKPWEHFYSFTSLIGWLSPFFSCCTHPIVFWFWFLSALEISLLFPRFLFDHLPAGSDSSWIPLKISYSLGQVLLGWFFQWQRLCCPKCGKSKGCHEASISIHRWHIVIHLGPLDFPWKWKLHLEAYSILPLGTNWQHWNGSSEILEHSERTWTRQD